jgi:hypothetical protein
MSSLAFSLSALPLWSVPFRSPSLLPITDGVSNSEGSGIRILEATYGDGKKLCRPNLGICNGRSTCEFKVTDDLCTVDAPVKNLDVTWDCGEKTEKHEKAEARGGTISLKCAK